MRLQLTIQRHGLPPVQILWTADGLRQSHTTGGASTTITQLLEQINEVIPLEAEGWGLEDYAVEVGGFECLHFAELRQLLKEDDHVSIRPLQSADLRFRRVSGRHQISADGKHLFDGVAFGRPFLRRPDRPAVRIPPRKRIRLTYDDDEEMEGAESCGENLEMGLRAITDDVDEEDLEDSEADDDFIPRGEELQSRDEELRDLTSALDFLADSMTPESLAAVGRSVNLDGVHEPSGRVTRSRGRRQGLGIQDTGVLDLVDENGRQYPGEYHNPLLDLYDHDADATSSRKQKQKHRVTKPTLGNRQAVKEGGSNAAKTSRRSSSASMKEVRFEEDQTKTPATILAHDDTEESDDEDFAPEEAMEIDSIGSDKENVEPEEEASNSSTSSSTTDESDSTLSSSSESDNESDSSETSSSLSSSALSGSESEVEEVAKSANRKTETKTALMQGADVPSRATPTEQTTTKQVPSTTPPGQGLRVTQKRNERRRVSSRLAYLKSIGVLPSAATRQDYETWRASRQGERQSRNFDPLQEPEVEKTDLSAAFESKRQELLQSIASGGLDIGENKDTEQPTVTVKTTVDNITTSTDAAAAIPKKTSANTPTTTLDINKPTEVMSEPPRRRATLDLASSRRLLFGSLGMRTPKTKGEESKLREKLMENVRPVKTPQSQLTGENNEISAGKPEADDRWRDKIVLRAVECCHEGIELSTPPFPFVQRWDPQQQGRSNALGGRRSGRGKKRKRNKKQFYEEDQVEDQSFNDATEKVQEDISEGVPHVDAPNKFPQSEVQRSETVEYQNAVDDQLMRDANGQLLHSLETTTEAEDLPPLPEDMSTCTAVDAVVATPGAIIAFKQLEMSQKTNWQPVISEYRTATIDTILEDGNLRMVLAKRDRTMIEKEYDPETGDRVHRKFDMPNYDDEMEDEEGVIELHLADLIESKLIRAADPVSAKQPVAADHHVDDGLNTAAAKDEDDMLPQSNDAAVDHVAEPVDGAMDAVTNIAIDEEIDKFLSSKVQDPSAHPNEVNEEGEDFEIIEERPLEVDEEARQEISLLIKDAGFRSSIPSAIRREEQDPAKSRTTEITNDEGDEGPSDPLSPKFNGFSSSSPTKESSKRLPEKASVAMHMSPIQTNGSSHLEPLFSEGEESPEQVVEIADSLPNDEDPKVDEAVEDISQESIETLRGMGLATPQAKKALEKSGGDVARAINWALDNPNEDNASDGDQRLAALSDNLDRDEEFSGQAWQRSSEEEYPRKRIRKPFDRSSPPRTAPQAIRPRGRGARKAKPAKDVVTLDDGEESDSDFPNLENVFSTARSTFSQHDPSEHGRKETRAFQRPSINNGFSQSQPVKSSTTTHPPRSREAQRLAAYTAKIEKEDLERAKAEYRAFSDNEDDDDESAILPRSTAPQLARNKKAQIVDLTISSSQDDPPLNDKEDEAGSEYDDYNGGLPKGSGWVQKNNRASRKSMASRGRESMGGGGSKARKTKSM